MLPQSLAVVGLLIVFLLYQRQLANTFLRHGEWFVRGDYEEPLASQETRDMHLLMAFRMALASALPIVYCCSLIGALHWSLSLVIVAGYLSYLDIARRHPRSPRQKGFLMSYSDRYPGRIPAMRAYMDRW